MLVSQLVSQLALLKQNDRVTEWPSDRVTEWLSSDQVIEWQSDRMTEWPSDQVTEWPNDRVTGSFADDWLYGIFITLTRSLWHSSSQSSLARAGTQSHSSPWFPRQWCKPLSPCPHTLQCSDSSRPPPLLHHWQQVLWYLNDWVATAAQIPYLMLKLAGDMVKTC